MPLNGRFPASALAPIGGGYYLEKPAAASFNAMSAEAYSRWGRHIQVISAYRTYDKQVYLWDHVAHAHDPNWVAVPGTSNHGWGLAVDLASQWDRWAIDQIGRKYGWSKGCSDAPVEWWHIRYNPSCTGATWKPGPSGPRVIKYGMHGKDVRDMQIWLVRGGWLKKAKRGQSPSIDGSYGRRTHGALVLFQRKNHLAADGVAGPKTIGLLKKLYGAPWPRKK
jgi:peptidoglycan hydrolase-like protein with peptidoglycan-binding domain